MSITHIPRTANGTINQFQAVRNDTASNLHITGVTSNFTNLPFNGISLSSAANGTTAYIVESGTVDSAIFNLGDGYACAVGVTSAGIPVRVTDPTCVSAPNYIGHCDGYGIITVSPRRVDNLNALDFGAIPNNSSSTARNTNTAANTLMQSTFAALPIPIGSVVFWPQGDWYFAADPRDPTAAFHITRPIHLQGTGGNHYWSGTNFYIPDTLTGIKTWKYGQNGPSGGITDDASGFIIEDIVVIAEGSSSIDGYGILVQTQGTILRGRFDSFGGHGIFISSTFNPGSFPDNWRVDGTRCTNCLNGIHVQGGDANNGLCISGDFQSNRGWGVYDQSFLGCGWVECHTADNCTGAYFVHVTGVTSLINCYSEQNQGPSSFTGSVFVIGGLHAAGFTPGSFYFGGLTPSRLKASSFYGDSSGSSAELVSSGTNPPRIGYTFTDAVHPSSIDIVVDITTAGYPGGFDGFSNAQTALVIKYSIDGGSTFTTNVSPPRADNVAIHGTSYVALASSGVSLTFSPFLYSLDNQYMVSVNGGLQSQFFAGSDSGTCAAWGWGHETSVASLDPVADKTEWLVVYNTSTGRWQQKHGNIINKEYVGTRSLPTHGVELHQLGIWTGSAALGYNRLDWVDGSYPMGSQLFLNSTGEFVQWYSVGDLLINRNQTSAPYPFAFRANKAGGRAFTSSGGFNIAWSSGLTVQVGDCITPSTPNGFIFRCDVAGTTGINEPSWPGSVSGTVTDNGITWENVGIQDGYNDGYVFEPVGVASPLKLTKDCTAGGTITLSFAEISHERYILTGSPSGDFTVIIGVGAGDSWDRSIWNTTSHNATIKATIGDTGVIIPTNTAYRIFSDGTNTIHVT